MRKQDKHGLPLNIHWIYGGYRGGEYELVLPGALVSVVRKVRSKRGMPVQKPKTTMMGNGWLYRLKEKGESK